MPKPSISTCAVPPAFFGKTPRDVPLSMTSPVDRVLSCNRLDWREFQRGLPFFSDLMKGFKASYLWILSGYVPLRP